MYKNKNKTMHFRFCWPRVLAFALHWPIYGAHFKAEIVGGAGQHAPSDHEERHIEEVHATVRLQDKMREVKGTF